MDKTLVEETATRLSFPAETSEPELESRAMKNKQTETKIEIWLWSHTSFNRRGTVFSSNQSDLLQRARAEPLCVLVCSRRQHL